VTHPEALALVVLAVPVVLAYLLRRRLQRRVVSSVLLYRALSRERVASRRLEWPRHLLSLLAILGALAAVVVALSRRPEAGSTTWAVLLDSSASMGALLESGEQTRMEAALDELEGFLRSRPEDRVALISTSPARLQVGATGDPAQVLAVARALVPAGPGENELALQVVSSLCERAEPPTLLVLSHDIDPTGLGCPVHRGRLGPVGVNVGITALLVREADALGLAEIYLAVEGDRPGPARVELSVDGEVVQTVTMAGGERLLQLALPEGEVVSARLLGRDALAADDRAEASIRRGQRVRVALFTDRPDGFLASALGAHPRVDRAESGTEVDLLVLDGVVPEPMPTARRVVALGIDPTALGLSPGPRVRRPEVSRWEGEDPLLRYVDLEGLHIERSWVVSEPSGGLALVVSGAGPLSVRAPWRGRELAYFGFGTHESDLGLSIAFAHLVANLVEWAAPGPVDPGAPSSDGLLSPDETSPEELPGAGLPAAGAQLGWWSLALVALVLLVAEWVLRWREP